jgi:hypothetical protein
MARPNNDKVNNSYGPKILDKVKNGSIQLIKVDNDGYYYNKDSVHILLRKNIKKIPQYFVDVKLGESAVTVTGLYARKIWNVAENPKVEISDEKIEKDLDKLDQI